MKRIDIAGKTFGFLSVLTLTQSPSDKRRRDWLCKCACGNTTVVRGNSLITGRVKSCGKCRPRHATHGLSKTAEYLAWVDMRRRCHQKTRPGFKDYGARGVSVCESWRASFENFIRDVGMKPSKEHTLDRINPAGNYEPGNVRWATVAQQNGNRRDTRIVEFLGCTMNATQFAHTVGVHPKTVYRWLDRGLTPERIYAKFRHQ